MIGLVACSSAKLSEAAPARELYQGALFKKQVAWLERQGILWVVLSALHGVVDPDQVIEPYDRTLSKMSPRARAAWATQVNTVLRHRFPGEMFIALAGKHYRAALETLTHTAPGAHMGIGKQLAFFGAKQ